MKDLEIKDTGLYTHWEPSKKELDYNKKILDK